MELNKFMNEHLRTAIDFQTFHLLDFSVTDKNKALVVLVPRNPYAPHSYFKLEVGDVTSYFNSLDRLLDYCIHFEFFSEKYANELTERYKKFIKK